MFLSLATNILIIKTTLIDNDENAGDESNKIMKISLRNCFSSLAVKIKFTEIFSLSLYYNHFFPKLVFRDITNESPLNIVLTKYCISCTVLPQ